MNIGRTLLWAISFNILLFWFAAWLGIYSIWIGLLSGAIAIYCIYRYRTHFFSLENFWKALSVSIGFLISLLIVSLPLFAYHDGLPTGDSQKAIFWAQDINKTGRLPNYTLSFSNLNRDPVDFYTPGLHALIAFINSLTAPFKNNFVSFIAVSLFSLVIAVSTAFIAGILAWDISQNKSPRIAFLTGLFVLTNLRFLRYIREPGYHLQNGLGELLLFGLLWVAITFRHRRKWSDIFLGITLAAALVISHQFSSFIAAFMLIPVFVGFTFDIREQVSTLWRYHRWPISMTLVAMIGALLGGARLGLAAKIPHIFSLTPHLLFEVPSLTDYPRLMGTVALCTGLIGFILMLGKKDQRSKMWEQRVFVGSCIILFLLSQGPRFGIDIPPIRALLYTAVPLSIGAAFFFDYLYRRFQGLLPITAITALLIIPVIASGATAYGLTHSVRTNSTLTPGLVSLNNLISQRASDTKEAVLVDDYDRRSTSWLLLSQQPTFSRIAADIAVQMDEAKQSVTRRMLYLNQLDYEKIIALGNRPEIASLLNKHSIKWVTGISGSTEESLKYNPLFSAVTRVDDITFFERKKTPLAYTSSLPIDIQSWLMRSTTLANDLGDDEDTFEHLPAAIRATRLSDPITKNGETWRETTAPLIPIEFNVGDYVRVLWSQSGLNYPDQALELLVELKSDPQSLTVETPDGKTWPLLNKGLLRLDPHSVPWNKDGFITLLLHNPQQKKVSLDMIALGLARVP